MKNSILIVVSCLIPVITILGCSKKKSSPDAEFLSSEVTKKTTSTTPTTQDIFDEFYKDESSSSQPKQEISKTKNKETVQKPSLLSEAPSFSASGKYVVQIAAVPSYSLAEKISKKLKEKGYPTYIAEVINPTPSLSGTYYRVRIGGFKGFSEAKEFGEKYLAPEGYEYWVDKRSNDSRGVEIQSTPPSGAYYNPAESQSKADYLYYTPSYYTSSSNETATTNTNATTNQSSSSGEKVSSSDGEKRESSQSSPPSSPQSQTQQPSSEQTEWKDEW